MVTEEPKISDNARLSSSQIAKVLGVIVSTISRYFKQGRIISTAKLQYIATGAEVKRFWRTYDRYDTGNRI